MTRKTITQIAVFAGALAWAVAAPAADKVYPGVAKVALYKNIGGTAVADLTGNAKYPNSPDEVRFVTESDVGAALGDNYGGLLEFVWSPKVGGQIQLAIAADDGAELWISSDETPANLTRVATEPTWNGTRAFGVADRRPGCGGTGGQLPCENISPVRTVVAGGKYLIRGLWKEGGGGDNYAIAVLPAGEVFDASSPVIPTDEISATLSDTPSVAGAVVSPTWVYVGGKVTLSASQYVPPGGTSTLQWFKDGVAIAGATAGTYEYSATAADGNKTLNFTMKQTSGALVNESTAASLQVIDPGVPVNSPGFLKMEVWNGLSTSDNSIDNTLLSDPRYPDSPDFVSYTSSFSSRPVYPDDSHEGYGGRISGWITPTENGDYRFFIYSDDSSRLYLSTDDKPANVQPIAEETACCNNFTEPDSPRTSEPVTMVANRRYYIEGIWKEGTGGDYLFVGWRKEGDTTAAGSIGNIPGRFLSTLAPAGGVTVTFTTQPVASANVEVGKSITVSAVATAFPINSVSYQWQKDGVNIPGANGASYTLPLAVAADVGKTAKYKLVATSLGSVTASSAEASVTTVADTFPPELVKAGSIRKAGKIEIGLAFNEGIQAAEAGLVANYSLSAGTIDAVRVVAPKGSKLVANSVVLVASGLTAGQTVTVTAKGLKDGAGNTIPAAGVSKAVKVASTMNWVGTGVDEINVEKGNTDYSDEVVALGDSTRYQNAQDFDLISGGSGNWDAYDEATFVYEEVTGDFDRVVRVEYQDPTSQWSRAGMHIREALDDGTTREQATGGPGVAEKAMSRNLSVRFSAPVQASGAAANNLYEVIDRNLTGGNYRGTPGGFGGAPNYPNAWSRISRVGKVLHFWKSDNGTTWMNEGTLDWEDVNTGEPPLAAKLFVGMYYAPEYNNNDTKNILTGSAVAQFRDYGAFPLVPLGGGGPGSVAIKVNAGSQVEITWDTSKGGRLQSANSVNGPYADEPGATSPYTTTPIGTAKYYRLTN